MISPIYNKLAKIIVEYSLEVEKGHQVLIIGPCFAQELFLALNVEILKAGAHPIFLPKIDGRREIFFKYASEEQLLFIDTIEKACHKDLDRIIQIDGNYNTRKFSNIDSEKIAKFSGAPERKKLMELFDKRTSSGELKWVIVPYPSNADAQEANMDL
ncbi:MAG: aminopeptidase, partial [Candidatus Odinarchaeota archaeon]